MRYDNGKLVYSWGIFIPYLKHGWLPNNHTHYGYHQQVHGY